MRARLGLLGAATLLLTGCAASGAPEAPAEPAPPAVDPAETAAMECITGAWVAETAALQQLFDETAAGQKLTVDGSIVYEFLEHGFGLNVIPTAFTMTMGTPVGDMVGEISGRASGVWSVRGEEIHVAADAWQNELATRWTFEGEQIEVDTGEVSSMDGFVDVDHFRCAGDELVLQSKGAPPLTLVRMTEAG